MKKIRKRRSRRSENRLGMLLAFVVVVVLMATVAIKSSALYEKAARYEERKAELITRIAEEEKRAEEIAEYETYTKTRKYIEEVARDKLGLVYEDETVFKSE